MCVCVCVHLCVCVHAEQPNRISWCPRPVANIAPLSPLSIRPSWGMRFCEAFVPELPAFAVSLEDVLSNCINQSSGQRTKISLNKFDNSMRGHVAVSCSVASPLYSGSLFLLPTLLVRLWWDLRGGYTVQKKAQRPSSLIGLFNILIEFSSSDSNSEHVKSEIYSLIDWLCSFHTSILC